MLLAAYGSQLCPCHVAWVTEVQNIHVKQQLDRRDECPDFVTIIFINRSIFYIMFYNCYVHVS